jgi:hypothetical protein
VTGPRYSLRLLRILLALTLIALGTSLGALCHVMRVMGC